MKDFFETSLCKSGDVCLKCRRSSTYRKGIIAAYDNPTEVDFACPEGKTEDDYPVDVEPNIFEMAKGFAKTMKETLASEKKLAEDAELDRRLEICDGCEFFINQRRCSKCGCFMKLKAKLKNGECPIGKW